MKKCPQCYRTYTDETLSFCLEDGALLSPFFNPQETKAQTFQLNNISNFPTVDARGVPTVAAQSAEFPTVFNSPQVTMQNETGKVGWKAYLAGLLISLAVDLIYFFGIYPYYAEATKGLFESISSKFDNYEIGLFMAVMLLIIPINLIIYAVLSFVLGFVRSDGSWRWGIIALIPNTGFTIYYFFLNVIADQLTFDIPYSVNRCQYSLYNNCLALCLYRFAPFTSVS